MLVGLFVITVFLGVSYKQKVDSGGLCLLIYGALYLMISSLNGFEYSIPVIFLYGLAPFIFYFFGRNVPYRFKTENSIVVFILIIVSCYCLDVFYVTANNIISTGEFINIRRDFNFTEDTQMGKAATLVGLAMDIGMVGLPIFIIARREKYRYLFLLLSILSIMVTLHLLNRTGLFVLLLCAVGVIGWKSRKKPMAFLSAILLFCCLYWGLQAIGVVSDELLSYYDSRNDDLYSMGDRGHRWVYAVKQLFLSPFGWAKHGEIYYVHNMWLDIARVSGIVPFIILIVLTFRGFWQSFSYIRRNENVLSYLLLGLNICFFSSCFVEPIYGGTHFLLYCLLWGLQSTLDKKSYNFVE